MKNRLTSLITVIAILVVASLAVGAAYAFIAETINSGNNANVKPMTVVVSDTYGDQSSLMEVALPIPDLSKVTSESENGPWSFNDAYVKTITGYIYAQCPENVGKMRVWVDMKNIDSWSVVERVTLNVYDDDVSKGSIIFQCNSTEEKILVMDIQTDAANTSYTISAPEGSGYTITGVDSGSSVSSVSYNSSTKTITFKCGDTEVNTIAVKVKADEGKLNTDLTLRADAGYKIVRVGASSTVNTASYNDSTKQITFRCGDDTYNKLLVVKVKADSDKLNTDLTLSASSNYTIKGVGAGSTVKSVSYIDNAIKFQCDNTNEKTIVVEVRANSGKGATDLLMSSGSGYTITGIGPFSTVSSSTHDSSVHLLKVNSKVGHQYILYGADSELMEVGGEPNRIELPIEIHPQNRVEDDWTGKRFDINVSYRESINVNPTKIDDLLVSRVCFVAAENDPVPTLNVKYCLDYMDETTVKDHNSDDGLIPRTYAYQGNVVNPPAAPSGFNLIGWYIDVDEKTGQGTGEEWVFAENHLDVRRYEGTTWLDNQGNVTTEVTEKRTLVLYAKYEVIEYSITFEWGGPTLQGEPIESRTYNVFSEEFSYSSESRIGIDEGKEYDLKGWSGTGLSGTQNYISIHKGSTGNRVYTAVWTYDVTFDKNGGTGTMSSQTIIRGVSINLTKMNGLTPPSTTPEKYFYGWNTDTGGYGTPYADNQEVKDLGKITLYAVWKQKCTITFNSNGGSGSMNQQTVWEGVAATLNANTFTKDGNVFSRWDTSSAGTGTSYDNRGSITITSDTTLHAIWLIKCTISFNANGGSGLMPSQDVCYNKATPLNKHSFTAPNIKIFLRWDTSSAGTGISYADGASVTITGNLELFAIWVDRHTITFNANGGTGTMAAQHVCDTVSTALTPNAFVREEWTFSNWATNSDGTGTTYTDRQSVEWTADAVLYAIWKCNLTYDANGGAGASQVVTVYSNNVQQTLKPANTFEAPYGKVFCEWNTRTDGMGISYSPETVMSVAGTITMYAIWGHTVTFYKTHGEAPSSVQNVPDGKLTALNANEFTNNASEFNGWSDHSLGISFTDKALISTGAISFTGSTAEKVIAIKVRAGATNIDNVLEASTELTFTNVDTANSTVTIMSFSANKITFRCQDVTERLLIVKLTAADTSPYTLGSDAGYIITGYDSTKTTVTSPSYTYRNIVLDAKWDYVVTFDINVCPSGFGAPEPQIVKDGEYATEPDMELDAYRVTWYTDDECTEEFVFSTPITDNITLYAKWDVRIFLVYNPLEGPDKRDMAAWFPYGEPIDINTAISAFLNVDGERFSEGSSANIVSFSDGTITFQCPDYTYDYTVVVKVRADSGKENTDLTISSVTGFYSITGIGAGSTANSVSYDEVTKKITFQCPDHTNDYTVVVKVCADSGKEKTDLTISSVSDYYTITGNGNSLWGWNTNDMGRGAYFRYNDSYTATNPRALYAIWKEPPTAGPPNPYTPWSNYYIIYYTNGGSGFMDMQAVSRSSPTVALNTVNSSYFYREGATFDHWDTQADDGGTDYSDGQTGVTLSGNITLFAIWKFNVTYDGNGSTGGSVPVVDPYAKGSTVTVLGNIGSLVKTGYVFNGWNTEADGSGTQYGAGDTFTITKGVVLYAQWVFAVTVTFDKNNVGATGTMLDQIVGSGVSTNLTVNGYSLTDHTFTGWNTMADGSGISYADGASITFVSNQTLYAQWSTP